MLEIDRRDRFNDTALHIAAVLGAGYSTLKTLIDNRHLPLFLRDLAQLPFDFSGTDDQGSTVLEILLEHIGYRYRDNPTVLVEVFGALRAYLISMASGDNLGRSMQSRLLHLAQGTETYGMLEGPKRVEQIYSLLREYYDIELPAFYNATVFDDVNIPFSAGDATTLENPVVRACHEPFTRDSYGCNGLHCLANVPTRLRWAMSTCEISWINSHDLSVIGFTCYCYYMYS